MDRLIFAAGEGSGKPPTLWPVAGQLRVATTMGSIPPRSLPLGLMGSSSATWKELQSTWETSSKSAQALGYWLGPEPGCVSVDETY